MLSLDGWDTLKSVCCKANAKQVSIDCDFPIMAPNLTVIARNGNQLCAALFPKPTKEDQKLTHAMVDPYYIYDTCKGTGMFNLVFCIQDDTKYDLLFVTFYTIILERMEQFSCFALLRKDRTKCFCLKISLNQTFYQEFRLK